jgi:hypothetical protein
MIVLALGALVLALMIAVGRRPLLARFHGRLIAGALAAVTAGVAFYEGVRGGWLDGSILLTAAVWLATSARPGPVAASPDMGLAEARSMLGVGQGAGPDEIEAAYRRLMLRAHPDKGGSAGLAAQLNAARDRLLKA